MALRVFGGRGSGVGAGYPTLSLDPAQGAADRALLGDYLVKELGQSFDSRISTKIAQAIEKPSEYIKDYNDELEAVVKTTLSEQYLSEARRLQDLKMPDELMRKLLFTKLRQDYDYEKEVLDLASGNAFEVAIGKRNATKAAILERPSGAGLELSAEEIEKVQRRRAKRAGKQITA